MLLSSELNHSLSLDAIAECAGASGHINREQLLQKSNEYLHRTKQLDRYSGAATKTTTHPDASHFTIHSPFNNNARPPTASTTDLYDAAQRVDTNKDNDGNDSDDNDENFERSEIDIAIEKGQVKYTMVDAYSVLFIDLLCSSLWDKANSTKTGNTWIMR